MAEKESVAGEKAPCIVCLVSPFILYGYYTPFWRQCQGGREILHEIVIFSKDLIRPTDFPYRIAALPTLKTEVPRQGRRQRIGEPPKKEWRIACTPRKARSWQACSHPYPAKCFGQGTKYQRLDALRWGILPEQASAYRRGRCEQRGVDGR